MGNLNQRRILPTFGNNSKISSQANSTYHALQTEVNKRLSRGFFVGGSYTWSRSIDMASGIALGAAVPDVFNLATQFGLSDFHAAHIGSFAWIWDLPALRSAAVPLRAVAAGWQLNGLYSARSGRPINIVSGRDVALSGTPNQRPNVVGEHRLPDDRARGEKIAAWFNRNAFALPANGAFGNVGRNALLGPPATSVNLGVFKHIDLPGREGLRLQFRSEFFNVFNQVNLNNPNTSLAGGTAMGRITGAADARVIQFALKLLY